MELNGRVALVTGAGRRLGREIAVALGGRGMRVAVHYNSAAAGAVEAGRRIEAAGGSARTFAGDLSQVGAPERLVADVVESFGQLDVLVNSAAIMKRTPFGAVKEADWDAMFAINLRAPFFVAQAAAPALARARGALVNIADLAALETWPAYIPHGITQAGVIQMTRNLARILAPEVRVNAIAPGAVLLPDSFGDDEAGHLRETTPLGRLGAPSDVTSAMLFLLEADYITGETIVVDGGRHIRR